MVYDYQAVKSRFLHTDFSFSKWHIFQLIKMIILFILLKEIVLLNVYQNYYKWKLYIVSLKGSQLQTKQQLLHTDKYQFKGRSHQRQVQGNLRTCFIICQVKITVGNFIFLKLSIKKLKKCGTSYAQSYTQGYRFV